MLAIGPEFITKFQRDVSLYAKVCFRSCTFSQKGEILREKICLVILHSVVFRNYRIGLEKKKFRKTEGGVVKVIFYGIIWLKIDSWVTRIRRIFFSGYFLPKVLLDLTYLKQFHREMFVFKSSTDLIFNHLHNTTEISWSGSHLFPSLVQKLNADTEELFECEIHGEKYRVILFTRIRC